MLIPLGNAARLLLCARILGRFFCRLGCYLQASYEKSEDRGTDGAAVL